MNGLSILEGVVVLKAARFLTVTRDKLLRHLVGEQVDDSLDLRRFYQEHATATLLSLRALGYR